MGREKERKKTQTRADNSESDKDRAHARLYIHFLVSMHSVALRQQNVFLMPHIKCMFFK